MDTVLSIQNNLLTLFEQQVAARPDAMALVMGDMSVSYGEANACSNQVARALRELGVGKPIGAETLVGVCMPRSPEAIFGNTAKLTLISHKKNIIYIKCC